jgi:hypothetical protein
MVYIKKVQKLEEERRTRRIREYRWRNVRGQNFEQN